MSGFKRLFGIDVAEDNLRIIITRHGERADLALGPKWASKLQKNGGRDPRISYLTPRADFREWNYDPPLTTEGERQSTAIGRKLLHLGYQIDYCYASPAYRSIQTADKLLESQGRKGVPINIEPGLFECPSWYAGAPLTFVPPEYLAMDRHFHINPYYEPIYDNVDMSEEEGRYYQRSRQLIDHIIKTHKDTGGTILLSGHAGSIETVARGMLRRRARPERLQYEADKVNYCNFAILERDAYTKQWTVHSPVTFENPYGRQRTIQSSIPLYRATSEHLPTHHIKASLSFADYSAINTAPRRFHRHRYR
ncbi:unnamed protein product [Adineta steineri]|uniref:Uncharacterized protein n=1 Tax=Adineta steineri TaxID=433720 RepID=A0A814DB86_9BILA|nr:unnamed protein product [Adineta steineri]CAF0953462.1 unnamed protein product [Adineta steineri]CAF0968673.1 unnamed protein product [Adineta steineri]